MYQSLFRFSLFILLSFSCISLNAKTLRVASDYWCPFICDNRHAPGILIEIINEIALNNQLLLDIQIMPLSRALKMATQNEVDIVLALTQQHISEFKLKRSNATFGGWYNDFYTLNQAANQTSKQAYTVPFIFNNNHRIGVIKGYHYGNKLEKLLTKQSDSVYYSTGNAPLKRNIRLLQKGRIDFLLDSRFNLNYLLSELNLHNIVRVATEGNLTPLYIGFNAHFNDQVITLFDNGIAQLKTDGKLQRILNQYNTEPWYDTKHL